MVDVVKFDDSLYYLTQLAKLPQQETFLHNKPLKCALNKIFSLECSPQNPVLVLNKLDPTFNRYIAERVFQILGTHLLINPQTKNFDVRDKKNQIDPINDFLWKIKGTLLPNDGNSSKAFYFQKNKTQSSKKGNKRLFRALEEDPLIPQFFSLLSSQEEAVENTKKILV
jgi:hypothetical protein